MEMTISQLRTLIANAEKDHRLLLSDMSDAATGHYIKETDSKSEEVPMGEIGDYMAELGKAQASAETLIRAKAALAELNAKTVISVGGKEYSLAGAIIALQIKREMLHRIEVTLATARETKRRIDKPNTPAYYDIVRPTFERKELEKIRTELREEICALEAKVDEANNKQYTVLL